MGTMTKLAGIAVAMAFGTVPMAAQKTAGIKIRSIGYGMSAPLRSYAPGKGWRPGTPPRVIPLRRPNAKGGVHGAPGGGAGGGGNWTDPDAQGTYPSSQIQLGALFQGIGFTGALPPDENLSVGKDSTTGETQIVQIVNTSYAVYDTAGIMHAGGDIGATLFSALPSTSLCAQVDGGDPVVLFDTLRQRWLIAQLAYNSNFTQNDYCLAISTSSDATGTYALYDIPFQSDLPDYPKLGVWSDGVYFSANMFKLKVNQFTGSVRSTFLGAQACSFSNDDETNLPQTLTFTCSGTGNTGIYNILPADLDGPTAPPAAAGSDYYLQSVDNLSSTSGNVLRLYQFTSGSLVALGDLTVGTFYEACGGATCVPQSGTTQQLDSLGDRLMYRLSYRNYGSSQKMVVNQSVQLSSSSQQTGIRWYELCSQSGPPPFSVCRESTFSPDAATYRWMGSIAQNSAGDLGLGYSTSSSSTFPSIAMTGLSTGGTGSADNGMEQEQQMFPGQGFEDTYSRWGDYSSIAVDPGDDCTFWYTSEYETPPNILGVFDLIWGTEIGSFTFPNCQ